MATVRWPQLSKTLESYRRSVAKRTKRGHAELGGVLYIYAVELHVCVYAVCAINVHAAQLCPSPAASHDFPNASGGALLGELGLGGSRA